MTTKAVAYIRTSSADSKRKANDPGQYRQELGAAAQRAAIEQWAAREGIEIAAIYAEKMSGGAHLDRRPILMQAVAATRMHGARHLVFYSVDRFTREPVVAALIERELHRSGASIAIVNGAGGGDDPTAKLVRGILVHVAEFERALTRARIRAAKAVQRERGETMGKAPYGYTAVQKKLVPSEHEQTTIRMAQELANAGLSHVAIGESLAELGMLNRNGNVFGGSAICRMLAASRARGKEPQHGQASST